MVILKLLILVLAFLSALLIFSQAHPSLQKILESWQKKRVDQITPKLDNMFLNVPLPKLILLDILSPVILGVASFFIFKSIAVAAIGGVLGLGLPLLIISQLERNRRQKFSHQLIDALMVLSGSLRAGLSLLQSLEILVEEMPNPISQEFSLVLRENRMGVPLEISLANLKRRIPLEDLDLIITSILVSRETGGDLTVTFNQLIVTIRERDKLQGRLKALTVQAKLQGIIMGGLPVAFAVFVYSFNPHFFDIMLQNETGRMLLIAAFVLEIIGIFFVYKFSKVDI
ncbi:MAG: type II secretion system F family protein [Candidatus Omnitrophica bacterium]|nr:type II secretion system F family protein [Candidatus Omnitrophota bacterium]